MPKTNPNPPPRAGDVWEGKLHHHHEHLTWVKYVVVSVSKRGRGFSVLLRDAIILTELAWLTHGRCESIPASGMRDPRYWRRISAANEEE